MPGARTLRGREVANTEEGRVSATRQTKKAAPSKKAPAKTEKSSKKSSGKGSKTPARATVKVSMVKPVVVNAVKEPPEGLPKKYFLKSTFNTHDIMHSPVEKTLKMLDKILQGERLFTM